MTTHSTRGGEALTRFRAKPGAPEARATRSTLSSRRRADLPVHVLQSRLNENASLTDHTLHANLIYLTLNILASNDGCVWFSS